MTVYKESVSIGRPATRPLHRSAEHLGGGIALAGSLTVGGLALAGGVWAIASCPFAVALVLLIISLGALAGAAAVGIPAVVQVLDVVDGYRWARDRRDIDVVSAESSPLPRRSTAAGLPTIPRITRAGQLLPLLAAGQDLEDGDPPDDVDAAGLELLCQVVDLATVRGLGRRGLMAQGLTRPAYDWALATLDGLGFVQGRGPHTAGVLACDGDTIKAALQRAWPELLAKGWVVGWAGGWAGDGPAV